MKRVITVLLILSMLLCGCGKETVSLPETTTSVTEAPAATEAPEVLPPELDAYRRVLEGRMSIFRIASQESIPISKISLFFTVEEFPWEIARFAVQDLDNDGVLDAVLEISDNMGYVILHYREDGIVTGEEIWHRAFQELKTDGSYRGAGSSFNRSYWKMHYVADLLLAECYEQEDGTPVYWVSGEKVDAEAFAAFEETQAAKPDAVWYENWENYVLGIPEQPAAKAASPTLDSYGAVLSGAMSFTDVSTGNLLDITRLGETITTEDLPCSVRQLAVLDLDQDGTEEAVLWLKLGQDDYAGFVILRCCDGTVYGYPTSYRSFLELKEDGSFRLSGGASYGGFGMISFSQSMGTIFPLAEAETEYLADGTSSTRYRINGESAAEADYRAFEEAQAAKADAVWYESWEAFLNSQT